MRTETIMLSNLNCPTCAADVESTLGKQAGVKEAKVTFGTATLELTYDPAKLSPAKVESILSGFGLGVSARV